MLRKNSESRWLAARSNPAENAPGPLESHIFPQMPDVFSRLNVALPAMLN
jgi:hypothetical protein